MDYAALFYELCFRELIKDIAEYCNSDWDEREKKKQECIWEKEKKKEEQECIRDKEKIADELEYIREKLEIHRMGFLFECILNKETYYKWLNANVVADNTKGEKQVNFGEVDFSSIRKNGGDIEDVIWILARSLAKYPRAKKEDEKRYIEDRTGYRQFEKLLSEINFPNGEEQLFIYGESTYYFNALLDNGDIIYRLKQECIVSYNGIGMEKDKGLFLNALKESGLHVMHGKLRELLKLYDESSEGKSAQEIDSQKIMQMARHLSDLVPVIDRDSKLKDEEQLQKEQIAVRFAVVNHFLLQGKNVNGGLGNACLRNNFEKYFVNHILIKTLFEEIYNNKENSSKEQILVITEGYLDCLEQNLELFKDKVKLYQEICEKFQDKDEPYQMYRDMWEKVWNAGFENE